MELENRTRGSCARPADGSLIHLSGSTIADTIELKVLQSQEVERRRPNQENASEKLGHQLVRRQRVASRIRAERRDDQQGVDQEANPDDLQHRHMGNSRQVLRTCVEKTEKKRSRTGERDGQKSGFGKWAFLHKVRFGRVTRKPSERMFVSLSMMSQRQLDSSRNRMPVEIKDGDVKKSLTH